MTKHNNFQLIFKQKLLLNFYKIHLDFQGTALWIYGLFPCKHNMVFPTVAKLEYLAPDVAK